MRANIQITSHAAGIVDPTVHEDGKVTFSVSEYYVRRDRRSRRQVMETSENGENIRETIERALDDEISMAPGSATIELLSEMPFLVKLGTDQNHPGGTHLKAFFFAHVTGERRQEPKMDGDEKIGPMIDIEVEELITAMENEGTVPVHLEATKAALAALAEKHYSVYDKYSKLLGRCPRAEEPSKEEWEVIRSYDKWFKAQ